MGGIRSRKEEDLNESQGMGPRRGRRSKGISGVRFVHKRCCESNNVLWVAKKRNVQTGRSQLMRRVRVDRKPPSNRSSGEEEKKPSFRGRGRVGKVLIQSRDKKDANRQKVVCGEKEYRMSLTTGACPYGKILGSPELISRGLGGGGGGRGKIRGQRAAVEDGERRPERGLVEETTSTLVPKGGERI